MSVEDQLSWERRRALPAGAAAIAAGALLVGATVYLQASLDDRPDDTAELLETLDRQGADFLTSSGLQALGLLALVPVLLYLYRVTKLRRPETPSVAAVLAVAGPLVAAALVVLRQTILVGIADDFLAGEAVPGMTRDERAEETIDDSSYPLVSGLGLAANLSLGVSVVLLSLHAMRAGLTSRFLGVIGIIVGVLYVIPVFGGPQIVQLFWLAALAMLFLGRWPGGRGPAWESGTAEPWPTSADRLVERQQSEGAAGAPNGAAESQNGAGVPDSAPPPRKRKRRR